MNNSNLFYDNKRVHISPMFCTLVFCPEHLWGGGGGGGGGGEGVVFWRSVFKYFGVPCLSIPAFHV